MIHTEKVTMLRQVTSFTKNEIIYTEGEFSIFKITVNSQNFSDVINLRKEHSNDTFDEHDNNAQIYVIYQQGSPLGTIRVIESINSDLDFETALPFTIDQCRRQFISSASRLAITKTKNVPKSIINLLIMKTAEDQFSQGVRFDLIACRDRLIPYYKRIGHRLLNNSPIIHPRTGASCYLMIWILTHRHTRLTNQYFSHLSEELEIEASDFLERIQYN